MESIDLALYNVVFRDSGASLRKWPKRCHGDVTEVIKDWARDKCIQKELHRKLWVMLSLKDMQEGSHKRSFGVELWEMEDPVLLELVKKKKKYKDNILPSNSLFMLPWQAIQKYLLLSTDHRAASFLRLRDSSIHPPHSTINNIFSLSSIKGLQLAFRCTNLCCRMTNKRNFNLGFFFLMFVCFLFMAYNLSIRH